MPRFCQACFGVDVNMMMVVDDVITHAMSTHLTYLWIFTWWMTAVNQSVPHNRQDNLFLISNPTAWKYDKSNLNDELPCTWILFYENYPNPLLFPKHTHWHRNTHTLLIHYLHSSTCLPRWCDILFGFSRIFFQPFPVQTQWHIAIPLNRNFYATRMCV